MRQRSIAVLGSIVLAIMVLACGSGSSNPTITSPSAAASLAQPTGAAAPTASSESPAPTIGKVGDKVELAGIALTVTKVDRARAVGEFQKAKDGNTFVIAEVLIENVSAEKASYNPFYFKLKDADGFEYDAGISVDNTALKSGDLAKGEKARGSVLFEVKQNAKGLVLEFKPSLFGTAGAIRVALE